MSNKPYMHHDHEDWAVPLRLEFLASYQWSYFHPHKNNRQFNVLPSHLTRGHKDNAPTDLRPNGVSSRRHTSLTQVLYNTGRIAKLILPMCTRHKEETQKPKKHQKRHSPQQERMNPAHTLANSMQPLPETKDKRRHAV